MFLCVQGSDFATLLDRLSEREELVFGSSSALDLDLEDIAFLARDVWRAKSAFADPWDEKTEKGLMRGLGNLHFTRLIASLFYVAEASVQVNASARDTGI